MRREEKKENERGRIEELSKFFIFIFYYRLIIVFLTPPSIKLYSCLL